jgi:DNA-binding response OmpR family regulator
MSLANGTAAYRPCLVVAHAEPAYAARACRHFRQLGWDVYQAWAGDEVRRLAWMFRPDLILLSVDIAGESGWLTCAKVLLEQPGTRIVLVGSDTPRNRAMADFVGAYALVGPRAALTALVKLSVARLQRKAG